MERLLKYFKPEKYQLDLAIDKHAKTLKGEVTVTGEAKAEDIKFHAVGLEIEKVLVDEKPAQFKVDGETLEILGVLKTKIVVKIFYHGKLNENMQGAYLSTYEYDGKTEIIVATQFESHYAREAFPCIDEPAAKAVFELNITVPDAEDLILTNVPMGEPTPRMSTYLLAFVIGKFHGKTMTNAHGTKITTYAALNQDLNTVDFANEIAARSLEFYDDNFGVKYPLPKLDQVALPDFEAGAMENWGLVTYRETMLLAGEAATLGTKKGVALTVAHELAHQWFGDLVTMEWWDDLWLNESFASVMEYFAVDNIHPEYKIFEGFFTGDCLSALKRDCLTGVQSVHQGVENPAEIATLFDPAIVYSKGARLMLMVIRMMGWPNFCDAIHEYFVEYQYSNAVGDDLWRALSKVADFDVGEMMHAFIDRPGYPVVSGKKQQRFLLDGPMEDSDWPIPEILEDMSGHYILNLTDAEFEERLARFDEMSLEEKLRLLIDRQLLAKTELVPSASLLPLVAKFKDESSAAVWNIIAGIIGGLKIFFEPDSVEEKQFQNFVKELVRPKLDEIGLMTRKGDDENTLRLRAILTALDFYAKDQEMLAELAKMYQKDYAKMDAETRAEIIDAKMYLEPAMLDEYLADYQEIADPEVKFEYLFATTLTEDADNLQKLVEILNQPEIIKPQDLFYMFIYLYRNDKATELAFLWLKKNWDYVRETAGDKSLENYPRYMANSVRTKAEFNEYCEFFEPMIKDPALKRAIEIGKNEIEARLKLINDDSGAVLKILEGLK